MGSDFLERQGPVIEPYLVQMSDKVIAVTSLVAAPTEHQWRIGRDSGPSDFERAPFLSIYIKPHCLSVIGQRQVVPALGREGLFLQVEAEAVVTSAAKIEESCRVTVYQSHPIVTVSPFVAALASQPGIIGCGLGVFRKVTPQLQCQLGGVQFRRSLHLNQIGAIKPPPAPNAAESGTCWDLLEPRPGFEQEGQSVWPGEWSRVGHPKAPCLPPRSRKSTRSHRPAG